ncbi:hypothetical protein [Lysobacter gummosus]|uniref:hypothetical protein n=1 Tax=Lysobacter gummosus TaxID=262324 RepID=UPI003640F2B9
MTLTPADLTASGLKALPQQTSKPRAKAFVGGSFSPDAVRSAGVRERCERRREHRG